MLKKIFYIVNYSGIVASLILYSLIARIFLAYGYQYASIFSDPKEMGMNIHYELAMPYAFALNLAVFLPIAFCLLIYLLLKKELHRDTVILCLLNIVIFYFFAFTEIGPITWLAD